MTRDETLARVAELDAAIEARRPAVDAVKAASEADPENQALHDAFVALHADVLDGFSLFQAMQTRANLNRTL